MSVPKWGSGRLKWDATLVAGATPATDVDDYWLDGRDVAGTPFVSISDMSRRKSVRSTTKALSAEAIASRNMPVGRPGTLLLAMYASVGEIAFLDIEATWSQAILGISPDTRRVDGRFLAYALLSMRGDLMREVRSNTQSNLNARQIGDIWFQKPALEEQSAVADYLDRETARIDTLIAEQERLTDLLRERRQATIESAMNWSSRLVPLGIAADTLAGWAFPSEGFSLSPTSLRLLRGINVKPGTTDWSDTVYWDDHSNRVPLGYELCAGDIVLGMDRPLVGRGVRAAVIRQADGPALLVQRVLRIRHNRRSVSEYLRYAVSVQAFTSHLERLFTGVSVPHVSEGQIRKYMLPLPEVEDQRRISAYLNEQTARIDTLIAEAQHFIELSRERRSALITAAVNGQIDVRDNA